MVKNISILKKNQTIKKLKEQIKTKDGEINSLFTKLNKIYHSKTWFLLGIYKKITGFLIKIIKIITPIWVRKKVLSYYQYLFINYSESIIPPEIIKEWNSWNKKNKKNGNLDIVNFSIISWDFRFQRPQQLASKMAKNGHRIFYIENEFLTFKNYKSIFAPIKVSKIENNIYKIVLSSHKNLFIYNDVPSKKDIKVITSSFKTLLKLAHITNPIAKIDHPFWNYIMKNIQIPYVYDCMDNHQGFAESGNSLPKQELLLLKNSLINFVSSNYLYKMALKYSNKNIILKNASDYIYFNKITSIKLPIPKDIKNISHPIIGYYGAIAQWFDTNILEAVAKANPKYSIVLIGAVTNNKVPSLALKYRNIYLLGEKKYQDLPNYLQQFDVCTIPFILNELIKATHPVKIFEFFAAGKPVVSTMLPEIKEYKDVIYFADKNNFSDQVNQALIEKDKTIIKKRIGIAKENDWQHRGKLLDQCIQENIFPKVSIIMLTYNNPQMSKDSIDSVLNRSFYPNMEMIIVDNDSNQETKDIVKSYAGCKNVKIILNKKNYGFAKGNNIGLKKAKGDYIILLNNDILVTPGWINRLIYHCQKSNVGLVGPVTNSIGNEAMINIIYNPKKIVDMENTAQEYTSAHWGKTISLRNIAAFCWIMSRETYNKIGDLDEKFGRGMFEDDDYCIRVKQAGMEILCAEDVFIHHYGSASLKKIQTDEYQKLFNDNKKIFETKWNTTWIPHVYRKQKV